jgi:hypothetical protein
MSELITKLSASMPKAAEQRTKAKDTKKGYDTTGYGYQYVVDRFNEVCGEDWGYSYRILKECEGAYSTGKGFYEITVEVSIWLGDSSKARTCVGGHTSVSYADALKGAITNAFKKTAAFWGVGADAYRGTIDDDNQPLPEKEEKKAVRNITEDNTQVGREHPKSNATLDKIEPPNDEATKRLHKVYEAFEWKGHDEEKKYVVDQIAKKVNDNKADVLIDRIIALKLPEKEDIY